MTKARPSAAWPQPLWHKHLFCKNTRMFNKLTIGTLWSRFTLLLDQNFNHRHQTLQFYWTTSLTVLIVDQETKHLSKTQELDVLEGDRGGLLAASASQRFIVRRDVGQIFQIHILENLISSVWMCLSWFRQRLDKFILLFFPTFFLQPPPHF